MFKTRKQTFLKIGEEEEEDLEVVEEEHAGDEEEDGGDEEHHHHPTVQEAHVHLLKPPARELDQLANCAFTRHNNSLILVLDHFYLPERKAYICKFK